MNKRYPDWICDECAERTGGRMPEGHLCTVHEGTCGVCLERKIVTEPRDYRYPDVSIGMYATKETRQTEYEAWQNRREIGDV